MFAYEFPKLLNSFNFKKGSEIITTSLTFSTTVAPIYQLGLVPHFIGVVKNKFVADPMQIEKCINNKTVAMMIPNLLGNIADWKKINKIAIENNIECDLALERLMACGFGICQGCTVEKVQNENSKSSYRSKFALACMDGPIFSAKEIMKC